jgi:hypothetical protein
MNWINDVFNFYQVFEKIFYWPEHQEKEKHVLHICGFRLGEFHEIKPDKIHIIS